MTDVLLISNEDIEVKFRVENDEYLFEILENIDKEKLYEYLKNDFEDEYKNGWDDALEWKRHGNLY